MAQNRKGHHIFSISFCGIRVRYSNKTFELIILLPRSNLRKTHMYTHAHEPSTATKMYQSPVPSFQTTKYAPLKSSERFFGVFLMHCFGEAQRARWACIAVVRGIRRTIEKNVGLLLESGCGRWNEDKGGPPPTVLDMTRRQKKSEC